MEPNEAILKDSGSLTDRVVEHLRELISGGGLRPGERVNEVAIAQSLGISRGPVREAIRRLTPTGLLTAAPNAGARVVSFDLDDIRHVYEVREALEAMAAGLAAARMTVKERSALAQMLDEHEAAMTKGSGQDSYPHSGSDWDFHMLVLKGARNDVAWRICGDELRDLIGLMRAQHGRKQGRGSRALHEHRWITEAIVSGNADLATSLMAQHIRASRDNLIATISQTQAVSDARDRQ